MTKVLYMHAWCFRSFGAQCFVPSLIQLKTWGMQGASIPRFCWYWVKLHYICNINLHLRAGYDFAKSDRVGLIREQILHVTNEKQKQNAEKCPNTLIHQEYGINYMAAICVCM